MLRTLGLTSGKKVKEIVYYLHSNFQHKPPRSYLHRYKESEPQIKQTNKHDNTEGLMSKPDKTRL